MHSVEQAVELLLAVERAGRPLSLTELARSCSMAPSGTYRYLLSLVRGGLLSKGVRGHYDLGPTLRRLGVEALRRCNEVSDAADLSERLRDATGHSVNLSVWSDAGPLTVRWDHGFRALPVVPRVGSTLPLLTSAAGIVFLASLPRQTTAALLRAELARLGPGTMTADEVEQQIARTQAAGYSRNSGGVMLGMASLAAALTTECSPTVTVVSLVFPEGLTRDEESAARSALLEAVSPGPPTPEYPEPAQYESSPELLRTPAGVA